jgi:hypothetical protein
MCTEWVPWNFTVKHKTNRKTISSELSACFELKERLSYPRMLKQMKHGSIILNQRQKWQSMEQHNPQSPRKKELKNSTSAAKVMISIFWDYEGVILVDAVLRIERGESELCHLH